MPIALHAVLESLARDTWDRLRDARALNIRFGEETVTDLLLLELKRLGMGQIRVVQTPKAMEKSSGTDWEWWIGGNAIGWLRFAVQAKKLDASSRRYSGLGHRVGSALQMDLLDRYAQSNDAIPMYCFYNYLQNRKPGEVGGAWQCCEEGPDEKQLACTVTPLRIARGALGKRGRANFKWLHGHSQTIPWRCLTKCQYVALLYSEYGRVAADVESSNDWPLSAPVRIHRELPVELINSFQSGTLSAFPERIYRGHAEFFPRRVAVFAYGREEEQRILALG